MIRDWFWLTDRLDIATLGECSVAAVAVDLQHAFEAGEMGDRPLGLAVGRVEIGGQADWRAPRSIVTRIADQAI